MTGRFAPEISSRLAPETRELAEPLDSAQTKAVAGLRVVNQRGEVRRRLGSNRAACKPQQDCEQPYARLQSKSRRHSPLSRHEAEVHAAGKATGRCGKAQNREVGT